MKRRGFTLIELVMVIVILGILAVVAVPQYFNLVGQAKTAAEEGVVGAVKGGIGTYYGNQAAKNLTPLFPTMLDSAAALADSATTKNFFENVLVDPIAKDWTKGATIHIYIGPAGGTYTYTPATGTFKQ